MTAPQPAGPLFCTLQNALRTPNARPDGIMFVVAVENDKKLLNKPAVAPHATEAWSGSERAPRLRLTKPQLSGGRAGSRADGSTPRPHKPVIVAAASGNTAELSVSGRCVLLRGSRKGESCGEISGESGSGVSALAADPEGADGAPNRPMKHPESSTSQSKL